MIVYIHKEKDDEAGVDHDAIAHRLKQDVVSTDPVVSLGFLITFLLS